MELLRADARKCYELEAELAMWRDRRDRAALELVAEGHTWREVAAAAGFANPYIRHLKQKARPDTPEDA
jgi:hypothetical protein